MSKRLPNKASGPQPQKQMYWQGEVNILQVMPSIHLSHMVLSPLKFFIRSTKVVPPVVEGVVEEVDVWE